MVTMLLVVSLMASPEHQAVSVMWQRPFEVQVSPKSRERWCPQALLTKFLPASRNELAKLKIPYKRSM